MSTESENSVDLTKQSFEFEKYVFLPHSPYNSIVCISHGQKFKQPKWSVIEKSLCQLRQCILSLEGDAKGIFEAIRECIVTYNRNIRCNFNLLEDLCKCGSSSDLYAIEEVICSIADAALKLPYLFPDSLPLLRAGKNDALQITAERVHCLLANAFLCTFPKRNGDPKYKNYPRINFTELFDDSGNIGSNSWQASARNAKLEKLKCFMNYFSRMLLSFSTTDTIIYERRTLLADEIVEVDKSIQRFSKLRASNCQSLEKLPECLQVDFANKMVGGGTLGNGSAMEEIKFVTCPALVAAQLFVECLSDKDVLLVHGYEQFSTYIGYGSSFKFLGDFSDDNVLSNHIVAMDAYHYRRHENCKQFEKNYVDRELNKCLCAFKTPTDSRLPSRKVILSGKWGCGVFNGHVHLKCLIQWMAASICDVPLELNTFGDTQLANEMNYLAELFQTRNCKVGEIYSLIIEYGYSLTDPERDNNINPSLIEFIQLQLDKDSSRQQMKRSLIMKFAAFAYRLVPFFICNMMWFVSGAFGMITNFPYKYLPTFFKSPDNSVEEGEKPSQGIEVTILSPKSIAKHQTPSFKYGISKLINLIWPCRPSRTTETRRRLSVDDSDLDLSDCD